MTVKSALAAGAAVGVLAWAQLAEAKPIHRHHHRAAAGGGETSELRSEVRDLKAEVQALEGRLDAQARSQEQTQAQAQAAQSQAQTAQNQAQAAQTTAQAAQTQAQAAQTQIETVPTEVATEVKKDTTPFNWAGNTKVGGVIFGDVSYIHNTEDGVPQPQDGVSFDIKRFYITVDHKFSDTYSANLTTDFIYDSGSGASQLFIKKAYVQGHWGDALNLRLGAADLPWVPFVESLYGYRYVEQVMIDRTKFGSSTDWGAHLFGSFNNGMFSYAVSVVNGNGYKVPSTGVANRTNSLDVEGRLSATIDGFTAGVGGYAGKRGKDVVGTVTPNTAERFDALLAYVSPRFRIGGEYFWARDWNDVTQTDPTKTNDSEGFSAFGSFNLNRQFAIFGRYDWVKPKKTTADSETENYFNVGISYHPVDIVDFALVYKRDKVDNGLFNTGNGLIGGVGTGTYDEVGLFTQIKF